MTLVRFNLMAIEKAIHFAKNPIIGGIPAKFININIGIGFFDFEFVIELTLSFFFSISILITKITEIQ